MCIYVYIYLYMYIYIFFLSIEIFWLEKKCREIKTYQYFKEEKLMIYLKKPGYA